uniref:Uncharacterized protein n=1 Tax=Cyprinus carpio TaxID=7962 RepID=A0A8C1XMA4_CYPCA
ISNIKPTLPHPCFLVSHSYSERVWICPAGTPERNTVCEKCPPGYYSSTSSSTEPCIPHRNCTQLGLKTVRPGTATQDILWKQLCTVYLQP